jgi:hypothetical protein
MDIAVIFDETLELGAIIDTESMRALGPVGGGPNARGELTQFVDRMPPSLFDKVTSYDLAQAYLEFWASNFQALYEPPPAPVAPVEQPAGTTEDVAALAEHEARDGSAAPPAPGPADSDMAADTGEAGTVNVTTETVPPRPPPPPAPPIVERVTCFACNGAGQVPGPEPGNFVVCNMCNGAGTVQQPVTA